MLIQPVNNYNNTLQITGNREPRPAEERIPSDAKEERSGATAIGGLSVLERWQHLQGFSQGTAAQGVLILLFLPSAPPELWHGRREAAGASDEDEEEAEKGGVENNQGSLEDRDDPAACSGG